MEWLELPKGIPAAARRGDEPDMLAPDGSEIRLLVGAEHAVSGASLCEVTLHAGQVSRPVYHRRVEEIWYVLEGTGQVWRCPPEADPREVSAITVKPGDAITIPTGWRFQFRACDQADLRFLCFTTPPWPGSDEAQPAATGGLGEPTV